jgi:hypothetical protein
MSQFKVGDVCVIVGLLPDCQKYEGAECVVVSHGCYLNRVMEGGPLAWYLTQISGKQGTDYVHFTNLRLKRPPNNDEHTPADEEFTDWLRKQCGVRA